MLSGRVRKRVVRTSVEAQARRADAVEPVLVLQLGDHALGIGHPPPVRPKTGSLFARFFAAIASRCAFVRGSRPSRGSIVFCGGICTTIRRSAFSPDALGGDALVGADIGELRQDEEDAVEDRRERVALVAHGALAEIQAYNLGKSSPCCSRGTTTIRSTTTTTRGTTTSTTTPTRSDPTVVAAGDLCGSATSCAPTANVVQAVHPTAVLTLGDNAYEDGTLAQYNAYYAPNWGGFKAITHPTTGNHDYHTSGAAGYFSYFGKQAPAPYYSYDLGTWHLIAIGAMAGVPASAGSAEEKWLRADLAAHPNQCVLAYWHEPRWSSGTAHGNDSSSAALWRDLYAAHADIVINGHEHNYPALRAAQPLR